MPFRGTLANLKKFSKAKCEVLHLDCGNPRHVYRSGKEVMERNPAKKDLGMVVGGKLNMSSQPRKPRESKGAWPSRLKEFILPSCSVLMRSHLECCILFWCAQKATELLEQVQRKAKMLIRGPENLS